MASPTWKPWRVGLLVVMCFLALAGWRAWTLGMADHLAQGEPLASLQWRSEHPLALIKAAELMALKQGPGDKEAQDFAQAALQEDPRDGRAYRVMGEVAERSGGLGQAATFYERAARLSPRDVPSRAWLASHHLRAGRPEKTISHLDFLIKIQPERAHDYLPLLRAMAAFPPAQPAMVTALNRLPSWRKELLSRVCPATSGSSVQVAPLFNTLRKSPRGLDPEEQMAWVDCLIGDRQWMPAYLTWASSLPPERSRQLANVFNGGFEYEPLGGGFDWRIRSGQDGVSRAQIPDAAGQHGLRVVEGVPRTEPARQLIPLTAGSYLLKGRARGAALTSVQGPQLTVTCADDNTLLLQSGAFAQRVGFHDSQAWTRFEFKFVVPQERCQAQWLQVAPSADSVPSANPVTWIDDLAISRDRDPKL